ncbi:MAG: YfhO family protein, partial [Anaerolineae bacterium]|nr:YfhO family protein [Anaerolineae bacterium]
GLSALAGHPQSVWFLGLLVVAFLGYRVWRNGWRWPVFIGGAGAIGLLGIGLALVQLLPAAEYLQHTTRIGFGFEAKRNGFPIQDIIQIVFPRVLSVWSPLYVGIGGLVLTGVAIGQRVRDWVFWSGAALAGLLFSFGGNAALYGLVYNVLPGATLFRGQERGAIVVAFALSVLVGLGMARLIAAGEAAARGLRRWLAGLIVLTWFVILVAFVLWLGPAAEFYSDKLPALAFSGLMALLVAGALLALLRAPGSRWRQAAVMALIVFDLFTVGSESLLTDPVPPGERLARSAVLDVALEDPAVPPARVDGIRGVMGNSGSLWQIPDMRGISPLWLAGPYAILGQDFPNPLAWELFAVRYVFTDWQELPVPSVIAATGSDPYGPINAHRLEDPRPFALLIDEVRPAEGDAEAHAMLADPAFDPRQTVILEAQAAVDLPTALSAEGVAEVSAFAPERITIAVHGLEAPAILSLALPHYPGWQAAVDGEVVPLLRAYGAFSAVLLPDGAQTVVLDYTPWTFAAGAVVSLVSWGGVLCLAGWLALRRRRKTQ